MRPFLSSQLTGARSHHTRVLAKLPFPWNPSPPFFAKFEAPFPYPTTGDISFFLGNLDVNSPFSKFEAPISPYTPLFSWSLKPPLASPDRRGSTQQWPKFLDTALALLWTLCAVLLSVTGQSYAWLRLYAGLVTRRGSGKMAGGLGSGFGVIFFQSWELGEFNGLRGF